MSEAPLPVDTTLYSNRDLVRLLVPLIIETALFLAVGTVDTMMIASLGEVAGASVALSGQINYVVACAFAALGTGGAVVASQALGAKDFRAGRENANHLLYLALCIGIFFMTPIFLLREPLLRLLFGELEPTVMDNAVTYLGITVFTYPFMAGYTACTALFRAMNASSLSMYTSLMLNVLNLVGNWFFIFVIKKGVAGAAISTLISHVLTLVVVVFLLTNKKRPLWLDFRKRFHLDWKIVRGILFIGIPSSIENALFQLGRLVVVVFIAAYGTTEIAGNAVAVTCHSIMNMVGLAFCLAYITVVGQSVGTGSEATVRYYIHKMAVWSQWWYTAWVLILLPMLPLIIKCFHKYSPEALHLALVLILAGAFFSALMWPVAFCFPNALRALNDVKYTMTVSVLSMLFVRVGLAWVLTHTFRYGAKGVWAAMFADWIVRTIFFVHRYRSGKWVALAHVR